MHPKSEQARVMSQLIFANKNNFMARDIYILRNVMARAP
jgi:hypothetical protein